MIRKRARGNLIQQAKNHHEPKDDREPAAAPPPRPALLRRTASVLRLKNAITMLMRLYAQILVVRFRAISSPSPPDCASKSAARLSPARSLSHAAHRMKNIRIGQATDTNSNTTNPIPATTPSGAVMTVSLYVSSYR